ncbi:MAG: hypothetical protein AAF481_10865 [Acidobacteriota bacterium]
MPPQPTGPLEHVDMGDGRKAPFYIAAFDKSGFPTNPRNQEALVAAIASGDFTHLYLFSHGWNNDWPTATGRYRKFFEAFTATRRQGGALPGEYSPLLVGVFWPSTALVFGDEKGPEMAALPPGATSDDVGTGAEQEELRELAEAVPADQRLRFYELAGAERLNPQETKELAELLLPAFRRPEAAAEASDEGAAPTADFSADDLVKLWVKIPGATEEDEDEEDDSFGMPGEASDGPAAAGLFSFLDPRKAVRMFTVRSMKDRAGVVGGSGVARLLRAIVAADSTLHTHLIGHSYGCKVVLSAIVGSRGVAPLADRAVTSALLLQPAINFWAFAADVDDEGFPGGYHDAPRAVRQPILSTFSKKDFALRRSFHLAVTRKKDLGEVQMAGPFKPERYGALGGWGPRGLSDPQGREISMPAAGTDYPNLNSAEPGVLALEGSTLIGGHGDVVSEHTAWALFNQVRATF